MVGHLCENVDGYYSYYHPVTVTSFAVASLAGDASSYSIYKSMVLTTQNKKPKHYIHPKHKR